MGLEVGKFQWRSWNLGKFTAVALIFIHVLPAVRRLGAVVTAGPAFVGVSKQVSAK